MDTKTGEVKSLEEFKEDLGPEEFTRKIKTGEIVPVPDEEVKRVKDLTWREKQRWLDHQAGLRKRLKELTRE